MHLTPQEQQQINGLVAEVEAASGAQLIVAVIGKADAYPEIPWKAFALAAVTSALLVTPVEFGLVAAPALRTSALGLLVVLATGLVAALAAMFVPPLGRVLLRGRARCPDGADPASAGKIRAGRGRQRARGVSRGEIPPRAQAVVPESAARSVALALL